MQHTSLCKCCTCGFEWLKGKDGSHNCSDKLLKDKNEAYRLVQNCILAGKYHANKDNSKFWSETEQGLNDKVGMPMDQFMFKNLVVGASIVAVTTKERASGGATADYDEVYLLSITLDNGVVIKLDEGLCDGSVRVKL